MGKLYYTVEKPTVTVNGVEECTGWKDIQTYEIVNDTPKMWFRIEARNEESSEAEIQAWLDTNGFGDREYEMEWL